MQIFGMKNGIFVKKDQKWSKKRQERKKKTRKKIRGAGCVSDNKGEE